MIVQDELNNTEVKLKKELESELDSILRYWIENTIDLENGGFVGQVDVNNKVIPEATKSAILNARILWSFSSASRVTGNDEYLEYAFRAYHYIVDNFIDTQYGGVFWELDHTGLLLNGRKQFYALSFAIYAFVEFYRITQKQEALVFAIRLFGLIEEHSYDKVRNGYIEALSRDWQPMEDLRLSEKDANESKTMNTHLHILEAYTNLYRVWKDEKLKNALENLIEVFLSKFINGSGNLNLFFDDDWNVKSSIISYGHDIECSWLLHEAADVLGNGKLIREVERISVLMAHATMLGLDQDGGLFNEKDKETGHVDHDKHWWPQAEAVVGFYNAYQIGKETVYLKTVMDTWQFIKSKIIDKEHGEWYWRVSSNGQHSDDEKVGFWKCPYHNSRMCMEIIERIAE